MKIMIASDIHGSAFYCEKMIEAYRREKADKLLLLGDILYHGPRNDLPKEYNPKKVIQMLNDIKEDILCVRGNCDTEVDQMVLEFPALVYIYDSQFVIKMVTVMQLIIVRNKDSLHMSVLFCPQKIPCSADFQIPHGDFKTRTKICELTDC